MQTWGRGLYEWSQGSLQASISTSRGRVVPRGSCAEIEQKGNDRLLQAANQAQTNSKNRETQGSPRTKTESQHRTHQLLTHENHARPPFLLRVLLYYYHMFRKISTIGVLYRTGITHRERSTGSHRYQRHNISM